MARLPSYITRIEGQRRPVYEARVNSGPRGSRTQLRKRFVTIAAAKAWHAEMTGELAAGTFVAASDVTVAQACSAWLDAKCSRVKPTTAAAYRAAMAPVIAEYGDRPVQQLTKADVERLIAALRDGTGDRAAWKRTSINPMLARWKNVWSDLHAQGVLRRDVVALVEPLRKPAGEPAMKIDDSLSAAEVETLLAAHADAADEYVRRREPFVHLALLGLRRAEIAGLRWSAVDLDAETPTLTIRQTRVSTAEGVIEQDNAKTASSARALPLPAYLVPILRRARDEQQDTRRRLGCRWEGDPDGHVLVGEIGTPLSPRTLNAWWTKSLADAGLPHRRLHASRHTAASLLNLRGAPVPLIASWLGHSDGGSLAMRVYVHTRDDALTAAAALLNR